MFHLTTATGSSRSELDIVLGLGFLLTVHDAELGPARVAPPAAAASRPSSRTARTTCCGRSATTSSTATSRSRTSSATRSTHVQDEVIAQGDAARRSSALFELKRELIEVRRAISPVREVFNQLTNRDLPLIDAERDRLLPRRLRPPHPPDRRARQLPRARVSDARRLPDPGQQQPVGDHEAADRRDGHPGRHRRRRRDLRDERGERRDRRRRGGRVLGRDRRSSSLAAALASPFLRQIDWI